MSNIGIVSGETPNVEEAINLYVGIGWGKKEQYNSSLFEKAFNSSHFILAYDNETLVGLVRLMTDNAHETNVSEFLVMPIYQKIGIGKKLLNKLYETYGHTDIYISTPQQNEGFFLNNGMFKQESLVQVSRRGIR